MSDPDLPLTPEDVEAIVAVLGSGAHDALEITTPRFRLRLARGTDGQWSQEWASGTAGATAAPGPPASSIPAAVPPARDEPGVTSLRPPLPGTFYRAPQPGAPPFVQVGDRVRPESVVCIIETMKLMNTVHAGIQGEVTAILAENGTLVDRDAVLMHIRPDAG